MTEHADNRYGPVYLIGSGPGDPGLMTIKGLKRLHESEAVVYDNLVPNELIIELPASIEKYYVGKKAGLHALPQEEINKLLVKLALEGKKVARLKGSDPLIFGRGGEEACFLRENNIPFEIIPGITAGYSVPAYAGIPCTDRERASMVLFVTGHKAQDKDVSSVPWDWVAKIKNGTLIVYMGVGEVEKIVNRLIDNGMPSERPAAVIERGTFATQRSFKGKLNELPDIVQSQKIKPPSIFVIGDVVNLQDKLKWFEDRPLFGVRVMITRPADQALEMYNQLRELGAEILPYPTITTEEEYDYDGWVAFQKINNENKWILFTSENGVRYFHKQLTEKLGDIRFLSGFKVAAVGFGTARAMERVGLKADFVPSEFTVAKLAEELCENYVLKDADVVRVRGNLGDDRLEKAAENAGATVHPLHVYKTFQPEWPDGFRDKLRETPPDVITFTSGSTCDGLCAMLDSKDVESLIKGKVLASIGPSTSNVIRSKDLEPTIEAEEHSIPGLVQAMVDYFNKKRS